MFPCFLLSLLIPFIKESIVIFERATNHTIAQLYIHFVNSTHFNPSYFHISLISKSSRRRVDSRGYSFFTCIHIYVSVTLSPPSLPNGKRYRPKFGIPTPLDPIWKSFFLEKVTLGALASRNRCVMWIFHTSPRLPYFWLNLIILSSLLYRKNTRF